MQSQATTPSTRPFRCLSRWLSLCIALMLAACASVGGGNPQDQVRQRASERWQALVAGEFSRAYAYLTPSYRAVVSADGYRKRFGAAVLWLGAEVVEVDCPEATKCLAHLRIDYKPLLARKNTDKMSTNVEETWLFEGGQWWFYQDI